MPGHRGDEMSRDDFRAAKKRLGLSHTKFARQLNVVHQTAQRYYHGTRVAQGPAVRVVEWLLHYEHELTIRRDFISKAQLVQARKTLGLSMEEMGKRLNVTAKSLSGYESGSAKIPGPIVRVVDWLLYHHYAGPIAGRRTPP